jgi:hypothetical protein
LRDRRLLMFAACILLFQLANAAMLPLMGGILTPRASEWATTLIGACSHLKSLKECPVAALIVDEIRARATHKVWRLSLLCLIPGRYWCRA